MKHAGPIVLAILDGFGYRKESRYNAIAQAKTPNLDAWLQTYPNTLLNASGSSVGLPDGYIGNSEVGHLTIGSGRVIPQLLSLMHSAIYNKTFFSNRLLCSLLDTLKKSGAPLHIMGLLSDAGIHSDLMILYAFLDTAQQHGIKHVFIHPFLDGRDVAPQSASVYLTQLDDALTAMEYGSIGSIHGRYYAMDRDNHWDRTQKSYITLTAPQEFEPKSWEDILQKNYARGITDEFIPPTRIDPTSRIEGGDGIIFFNIRPDRARQLTAAFIDPLFNKFPTQPIKPAFFMTPTRYADSFHNAVLFESQPATNTLKDVLAAHHKTIYSIAETEKYAHITYFFGGGREEPLPTETRVLIPSLPERNYSEKPSMSADTITHAVLQSLAHKPCDFYLINYANADMVGHSGNLTATIAAVECLDRQLEQLYHQVVTIMNGTLIITADHGKAEEMFDTTTHQVRTAHTTNQVPYLVLAQDMANSHQTLPLTQLADIAPYILTLMGLPIPPEMRHKTK